MLETLAAWCLSEVGQHIAPAINLQQTKTARFLKTDTFPTGKAVDMSYDHKPEDEVELARIKNAGGKVTMDGRVNGGLNLSRAIGTLAC